MIEAVLAWRRWRRDVVLSRPRRHVNAWME